MSSSAYYAINRQLGSMSGYVNKPVFGPLSTNRYPNIIPKHNYGTLTGQRPTPPQFLPSQEPINSNMNTTARAQYVRATSNTLTKNRSPFNDTILYNSFQNQRSFPVSNNFNYIEPIPSSMYVDIKKSVAVGKSALKVGLPLWSPISTKNYYPSGVRTSLRRARSGGCTAPKKKGSIYNTSLTQSGICAWGSLVRDTW